MNTAKEYNWIPFHVVACTSQDFSSPGDHLSTQQYGTQRSWECSRTADFPIEMILRFHYRTQLDHILIATKVDRTIPKIEFWIGDGLSGGFHDCEYRLAGSHDNVFNKSSQIKLHGIGSFLKLLISEKPKRSPQNPYAQVAIATLKIWGAMRHYLSGVRNEQLELMGAKDSIDKMLIDMGIPVDMLNWFEEDDRNYQYAPIDPDTRDTLEELKRIRDQALKLEDYEALKQLKKDMREIFEIGKELWRLKRELGHSIAKEDYMRANTLKRQIQELEAKRDRFDALYETSRYEHMVSLKRPTTAEYLRHLELLEAQEHLNSEALRRQRELEEQRRRQMVKEEQNKFGVDQLPDVDKTPWWDKSEVKVLPKKARKKQPKEEDEGPILSFKNPFAFNEGDVDLELYVNPLLAQVGEKIHEIPIEVLRRLHQLGYLTIFGARVWTGIHSENWRVREAVAQAVLNFLEMPLPDRYQNRYSNGKTKKLFLASMEFAKLAVEDKILQIYFLGLKILSTALAPPVCGSEVSPAIINKVLKEFTPILILKIEEFNYRARDISLHTLLSVYRHPAAKIGILIHCCLDKLVLDPKFPSLYVPPDKQPQRVMLAKLEIVLNVLQEFGYDQREFSHEDLFFVLATPCLYHPSNEVRLLAIEVIACLYQLVGQEIRAMLESIENIKPNLKEQILQRLAQVNEQKGERGLSLVVEQAEEDDKASALLPGQQPQGPPQPQGQQQPQSQPQQQPQGQPQPQPQGQAQPPRQPTGPVKK